jgi:hypothetical protein
MSSGLLEVRSSSDSLRLLKVRTLFGGQMWVIRPLASSEVTPRWDVPEKLGRLLRSEAERIPLMKEVLNP